MKYIVKIFVVCMIVFVFAGCNGVQQNQQQQSKYALNIEIRGEGSVKPSGAAVYEEGTVVEITPEPASGWHFDAWSGTNGSQVADNKIVMDGDKSLVAVFSNGDYMGYNNGAKWEYTINNFFDNQVTSTQKKSWSVISVEQGDDRTMFKFMVNDGGQYPQYANGLFYGKSGDSYSIYGEWGPVGGIYSERLYNVPLLQMIAPLNIGDHIYNGGVIGTVVRQEPVTIPLGTFNAFVVDINDPKYKQTSWFVPYVGYVKVELTEKDGRSVQVGELTSFTRGI